MFVAEVPTEPTGSKQVLRVSHNPQTGKVGPYYATVTSYRTIRIGPGQTSEPLDESILEGPGFKKALKDKWLRIVR